MREFQGKTRIRRHRTSRMPTVATDEGKLQIVDRCLRFFNDDETARHIQKEARLQRYAKYRMVRWGKSFPWDEASDVGMPDMMSQALHTHDILHNAVMSSESPVAAHPLDDKGQDNATNVDKLLTHQLFVDMPGELLIGDLAEAFVDDGVGTVMTPWIREKVNSTRIKTFGPLQKGSPRGQFKALLTQEFPDFNLQQSSDGWDWVATREDETRKISFYTLENDRIEMVVKTPIIAFDGPRPMVYNWENVLHPPRVANLNFPSDSNPRGAPHVILKQFVTINQLAAGIKSGFYDLGGDPEDLFHEARSGTDEEIEEQKDQIAGDEDVTYRTTEASSHKTLTLLIVFDGFDINDDGIDEQVVWWVVKEKQLLLKAALLEEMWPFSKPKRPFAECTFIPVEGRRQGISLLEMVEPFHDVKKMLLDQAIDAGTIANSPWFFYRPSGGTRPEVISLGPGDGYPLADPKNDVFFPQIPNSAAINNLNIMRALTNDEEKLTMAGDIQFGMVPPGASSALRTATGIALLQNKGEARPERILRRFFICVTEIYSQMHDLNTVYLTKAKRIMIMRPKSKSDDPYETIGGPEDIAGQFQFTFKANVFNTSKLALQQSLGALAALYIQPVAIQLGLTTPDTIYRLYRDLGKAQGQDPDQYLQEPSRGARKPRKFAEEAISTIMAGQLPDVLPIEGAQEHMNKLIEFANSNELFGQLDDAHAKLFNGYMTRVRDLVVEEQQTLQLVEAAARQQPQEQGQPAEAPNLNEPNLQENQPIDRSVQGANGQGTT